jgi:uncharacterized membrane protein YjdF
MAFRRTEWVLLASTIAYILAFLGYFVLISNREFMGYIATMVLLVALVGWIHRSAQFPMALLWALSGWGLAHMAGGGIRVGDGVLYNLVLVHLAGSGELTILKYDQVVHFYGFGVTAWLLWYLLDRNFPPLRGKKTIYIFPALASMGLGAMNEIVEFTAVMTVPDTNVGGYYNTALDLVANGSGAVVAMIVITLWPRSSPAVP